ncbi:MAG TPA: recombinase family protein [Oligoflexus sp.]|uniref:recombinase family protein n=1 Tax=Oligoflexus sp. TaxID=1971216 RepID=UPI002D74EDAD|nr:recombinase family protein [Oligoflexus sp.]HYX37660.1 recombinase family protein [Oligoflexus sp.]
MDQQNSKVKQIHLNRDAYLYIRQSSLKQFFENTESLKRQYALQDRAISLGWSYETVKVIDSDLGQSGSSKHERSGFRHLVAEVGLGHVGIVMGLEVSRLARNSADWQHLIEICALTSTLILDEDGIYDPKHFNDRLLLGLKGTMSEAELHFLRDRLIGGILNKAKRAELEIPLPIGFRYSEKGKVIKDPDRQVQSALIEFFKTFRNTGSATSTVKFFRQQALQFPRNVRSGPHKGELLWEQLAHSQALRILHNPRYAGAFAYGRTSNYRTVDGKSHMRKLKRPEWTVFVPDVHEGYITLDEFERNQDTLKKNARACGIDRRGPPRECPAILQGIAVCGKCGSRMTVRYHIRNGLKTPDYLCQSSGIETGQKICQSINGVNIDHTIVDLLESCMKEESIGESIRVEKKVKNRLKEVENLRKLAVNRARYEADLAERRYRKVDPSNRLVADTLEGEWNGKLRNLADAERTYQEQICKDSIAIDDNVKISILGLVNDFPVFWRDPNLPHRERKRIVQLLIDDVTLLKIDSNIAMNVRFKGAAVRRLKTQSPPKTWIQKKTDEAIVQKIDQLLDQHTIAEIADILNKNNLRSGWEKPFRRWTINRIIIANDLKTRFERLRKRGLLTSEEIAKKYKVSNSSVRTWYKNGLLKVDYYDDKNSYLCLDPGIRPFQRGRKWIFPERNIRSSKQQRGVV